ncbi:17154_t:CDS:1 [Racocetra fulgida]|uniref:17154_t:CDS:1 n=1 Tax=Racocetra fulgida TaxID=60492 RepID=A0A9N9HI25_9GLOM|nr:17154_t:CDS:1 [Racocetra fulgida]
MSTFRILKTTAHVINDIDTNQSVTNYSNYWDATLVFHEEKVVDIGVAHIES